MGTPDRNRTCLDDLAVLPAAVAPKSSWWVGLPREAFQDEHARQLPRLLDNRDRVAKPMKRERVKESR